MCTLEIMKDSAKEKFCEQEVEMWLRKSRFPPPNQELNQKLSFKIIIQYFMPKIFVSWRHKILLLALDGSTLMHEKVKFAINMCRLDTTTVCEWEKISLNSIKVLKKWFQQEQRIFYPLSEIFFYENLVGDFESRFGHFTFKKIGF